MQILNLLTPFVLNINNASSDFSFYLLKKNPESKEMTGLEIMQMKSLLSPWALLDLAT